MDNEQVKLSGQKALPPLKERLGAKVTAFVLLVLTACAAAGSIIGACLMLADGFYTRRPEDIKQELLGSFVWGDVVDICRDLAFGAAPDYSVEDTLGMTNLSCRVLSDELGVVFDDHDELSPSYKFNLQEVFIGYREDGQDIEYDVDVYINKSFPIKDKYYALNAIADTLLTLRYWIYAIALGSIIASILLFCFLISSAGHRAGRDGVAGSFLTKIPLDLFWTAVGVAECLVLELVLESGAMLSDAVAIILMCAFCVLSFCVFVGLCINFTVRVRMGKWWKNTVIYMLLHLLWLGLKMLVRGIGYVLRRLPLIWKTLLGFVLFALLSLMAVIPDYIGVRMGAWMIGLCLLFAAVVYTALVMRRLQIAVRKLARGDLSCRVDTRRMIGDFKEHGENLNSIGFGMTRAVDERMKSERLKTELITNVSHDIKTPLTSIINYVDLISKEDTDNEKIKEYTDVLSRQSERLKKLIEDLVEASKASTGNVDVSLAPCDVSVLISQSVGEYGEKLENAQLELLISKPEQPLMIMADGRLLWRVFDNLMNNVCKYAMPGTRVYMTLELSGGEAVVSIKNISKYPLNIKAEELMERFVRGDSSRSTEGSGLGLSIAGSLTSLMGGKFSVEVDGDLFKATLRFKKID